MSEPHCIQVVYAGRMIVNQYGQADFFENANKALDFLNGRGNEVFMNIVGIGLSARTITICNPKPFERQHFERQELIKEANTKL